MMSYVYILNQDAKCASDAMSWLCLNLSYIYLGYFVCLCVCVCVCVTICVGTLCYFFSFSNQTDKGDETEGLKREGLKMER